MSSEPVFERIITASVGHYRVRLWLKAGIAGIAVQEYACRKLAWGIAATVDSIHVVGSFATAQAIDDIAKWNRENDEPIAAAEVTDTRTGDGNLAYFDWP